MNSTMTGRERIANILQRKPVDRIGVYEHFWPDTHKVWSEAGKLPADELFEDHFGYDIQDAWGTTNLMADIDFGFETLEETEETILLRDGNGAILRRHKQHVATPEHVDFAVKDREAWEALIKPKLTADPRRINFENYRECKRQAAAKQRFFCWSGVSVFELMFPVCGHEHLLMGMITDPEWIEDMVTTYTDRLIELHEILFAQEGPPDGMWYCEDMGFKERPFMSPAMYKALLQPAHTRLVDHAHSYNLPVIMHSCGFIEPLLPGMVEAGIDCLQALEVKAGMDPLRIQQQFGDRLSLMGGLDERILEGNNPYPTIDAELETKIPLLKQGYGYVLHTDHSVPGTVSYEAYRYFIERGLELGRY